MSEVTLRTPAIEEYDEVLDLWEECEIPYRPAGRDSRESIADELAERPEYWIGAYAEGELIGVVVGTDDGRKAWVNRLAVHPEYRNRGVGTRLLESLESAFDANGFEVYAALIEAGNDASRSFFEERGYETGPIRYYSKRTSDRV